VLKESAHVLVANEVNRIAFHHLLVFLNIEWINHAPNETTWLDVELKLEITANRVWIHIECLKRKDVIEWKVNLELYWMWESVLELGNINVSTANGWAVDRNVLVKGMNILTGLLFVAWLECTVSETFTATFVLLITSREVATLDLKLIKDLVR
jgi:hypothetical protein